MRKCIGSALLLVTLATFPALSAAQRRGARPAPARSGQRTSFGLQLDVGTQTDFGIGGRAVFGLQSLFPGTPLDGIVSFDYYFPSAAFGSKRRARRNDAGRPGYPVSRSLSLRQGSHGT